MPPIPLFLFILYIPLTNGPPIPSPIVYRPTKLNVESHRIYLCSTLVNVPLIPTYITPNTCPPLPSNIPYVFPFMLSILPSFSIGILIKSFHIVGLLVTLSILSLMLSTNTSTVSQSIDSQPSTN